MEGFNPFGWFGSKKNKGDIPEDVVRQAGLPPDVFYSPENAENLRQQIEGDEVELGKVPVGATVEVRTDNTLYAFKKVSGGAYLLTADPSKTWIQNGLTEVEIVGALPGGGLIVVPGVIREGAGIECIVKVGANKGHRITMSPARFAKISF